MPKYLAIYFVNFEKKEKLEFPLHGFFYNQEHEREIKEFDATNNTQAIRMAREEFLESLTKKYSEDDRSLINPIKLEQVFEAEKIFNSD